MLATIAPISISGGAYALNYLQALTVGGTPITSLNWPAGAVTDTLWAVTWNVTREGPHSLDVMSADWLGNVITGSEPVTVTLDTQPPAISVSPDITTTRYGLPGMLELAGLVTDTAGVAAVQVMIEQDGVWLNADPIAVGNRGNTWRLAWYAGADSPPDGTTYIITARAVDLAGHTSQVTETVLVDVSPPAPVTLTMSSGKSLAPGDTVREPSPTLTLTWTPSSDASPLGDYRAVDGSGHEHRDQHPHDA